MLRVTSVVLLTATLVSTASGQTPQPFPRQPGATQTSTPPAAATPGAPQESPPSPTQPPSDPGAPTAATLGAPVYPAAQFLGSYDAGRGQRYYIFGAAATFADVVLFYRTQLNDRGDVVFKDPPTHMFDVGRFRDETMAFPPGVTVKDWTSGGSQGYPHPKPGGQPARFPTVIMIVPPPVAPTPADR